MLKLIFLLGLGLSTGAARSQTIVQLTEQLVFDAQKLTSMKSTLKQMYTGYDELKNGYTRIRDLAKRNFNLHQAFLDALWVLSPAVRSDPRITEIINTEYAIVANYKQAITRVSGSPVFTVQELTYITGTLANLLQRSLEAVEELGMITTDNELRMSDAQRLEALDRIDTGIKDQLAFLQRFDDELAVETARRNNEANDINTLKSIYGLSN